MHDMYIHRGLSQGGRGKGMIIEGIYTNYIMNRMLNGDPVDNLTSAADEYQNTAEHLSLSQSFSQGQQNSQGKEALSSSLHVFMMVGIP